MSGYKVLGTTGDVDHCECCGRRDLRKTVMLVTLDVDGTPDGDTGYYGTSCAARLLGTTAKQVTDQAARGDRDRREEVEVARRTLGRYADVESLLPLDAVLRYVDANWRHTDGMDYDAILAELRAMVSDARRVLGLDKPRPADITPALTDAEETPVKPTTAPLFDVLPLLGQTTVEDQVADALAEETAPALAPVVEAPAVEAAVELPGDGTLFALRVTDTPTADALFGLSI